MIRQSSFRNDLTLNLVILAGYGDGRRETADVRRETIDVRRETGFVRRSFSVGVRRALYAEALA